MRKLTALCTLALLAALGLPQHQAYAACASTLSIKDGTGTTQADCVTTDGSGNLIPSVGVLGGSNNANKLNITSNSAAVVEGTGTAGTPAGGIASVQGVTSMTPLLTNPGTAANIGVGATASAVPANAVYQGANVGGNTTGMIACGSSVVYDASTNGATQLVALASSQKVYVCGYTIFAAGTVNVELDYGTGTACATGNNKLTPAYQLTAQTGVVDGSPYFRGMAAIASNELCIKTSAGVAVQAVVYYSQF